MTSPHLAAPSASSGTAAVASSPALSQTASTGTAATFGAGAGQNNIQSHRSTPAKRAEAGGSVKVIEGPGGRILCVADARGDLSSLNRLATENNAQAIIHTGDFGFYDKESFERISDRTLRHLVQYSTLIPPSLKTALLTADVPGAAARNGVQGGGGAPIATPAMQTPCKEMRNQMLAHPESPLLTQFPRLLSGDLRFNVPVFTVWGACEDVRILEKFRIQEFSVPNLHILDEATTHAIEVGGIRLRIFGLGGAVVLHKLFDNGEGAATIAGGQGTMWTTILQIGELMDTAQRCYDPTETRLLVTHASPGREGLLMQLALALKADLTISAGLHFRYGVSYNEFSVQTDTEPFRRKLMLSKSAFGEVWESVRQQVEDVVDDRQRVLLNNGLAVTNRVPNAATATGTIHEDPAWKNTWNWNLPDAAFGHLILDISDGRVGSEMKSQGFNFAYRRAETAKPEPPLATVSPATGGATPQRSPLPPAPATQQSLAQAPHAIPSGPARMRQQHDSVPRGPLAPKSPKHLHAQHPSSGDERQGDRNSRPASSRGPRSERGARSSGDEGLPRGPRNGSTDFKSKKGQQPKSGATDSGPAHANQTSNGASEAVKSEGPAQPYTPLTKTNATGNGKGHRSKKSGASTRSDKSGSEAEAKPATKASGPPAAANEAASATPATAVKVGEAEGPSDSPTAGGVRGGRGGRGGGRGGRGGRGGGGGGGGRGGSNSQDRRKSAGADAKPAPSATTAST